MIQFVLKIPAAFFVISFSALFFAAVPAYSQTGGAFRLIGTIEGGSGFTGAVLDDNSGTQTFYRVREALPDGSRIVKIARDRISIKRSDGSSYELHLVQSTKPGGAQPARAAASPAVSGSPEAVPASEPVRRAKATGAPELREAGSGDGGAGSNSKRSKRRRPSRNTEEE